MLSLCHFTDISFLVGVDLKMAKFGIIGDIDLDNLDHATKTQGESQEDQDNGEHNEEMSTDPLSLLTR